MGIIKLIFAVLLVFGFFFLLKKFRKPDNAMTQQQPPSANKSAKILACSVCKTHIPENQAIIKNGKVYCSKEHLE